MDYARHCIAAFFLIVISYGCNNMSLQRRNYFDKLLKPVDKIQLVRFNGQDTTDHFIRDEKGIRIFTAIITGKDEEIPNTAVTGQIIYFSNAQKVFTASVKHEGIQYTYQNQICRSRLSYRAGMYFDNARFTDRVKTNR